MSGRRGHVRADVMRPGTDDPLRSPHGGRRRPGGAQRPGTGPPPGDRPPRRAGAARERAFGNGRGPGGGADSVPLDTLPSSRPTRPGGIGPRPGPSSTRPAAPRPGWALPSVRGPDTREVVHPLRTGIAAGCRTVILTAAAGGIRDDLATGSVMVVEDHLNLTGRSPLVGPDFVDMADAYDLGLRALALATPGPAAAAWRPAPGSMPTPRPPVRDAGRNPHAAYGRRRRRGDVDGARDHRRPPRRGEVLGLALVTNPAAAADATIDFADIADVGTPPCRPWPPSSATS